MLFTTLLALGTVAMGPAPVTAVRPAGEIIEIRPGMIDGASDVRRDQVRFYVNERAAVVGGIDDGQTTWNASSERERLGGQEEPELILVRAFDAVFAIDPFEPLPSGDIGLMRQLLLGTSLDTDRTLFDRRGIERTEELMSLLESARVNWLRDRGYYNARTVRNPRAAVAPVEGASLPEPSGWIRIPEDMPRGKSKEQVNAQPEYPANKNRASENRAGAIAGVLLTGDEPVRISLPFGTAPDVVASVERRNGDAVASR